MARLAGAVWRVAGRLGCPVRTPGGGRGDEACARAILYEKAFQLKLSGTEVY